MIRLWFGALPTWTEKFKAHIERLREFGWDFLIVTDEKWFAQRMFETTGLRPDIQPGTRKAGDYDPALGMIFAEELHGYDFWGHFNLDCVYGRLERWLPDAFLENVDIFGNDPGAICGPFTVYRNDPEINRLFLGAERAKEILESGQFFGFDEAQFNRHAQKTAAAGEIQFASAFFQAHDKLSRHRSPQVRLEPSGALIDVPLNREICMFHFNATRTWPV